MVWIAVALAVLTMALGLVLLTRTRRRPAIVPSEVQSMRSTLERKVREGADFRF